MTQGLLSFIHRRLKKLARSESGMTLPMTAVSLIAMMCCIGLGIDVARIQMVQSKLQFSLDAAGLAAGSTISTADLSTEATKYLTVNFNGYMGATLNGVSITPNSTTTVIKLLAAANVPTTFLKIVGVNQATVNATTQVSRNISGLEVTVIVDVSYGDDLTAFKQGLNNFITKLFQSAPGASNALYVSIVPFNHTVNVGTNHAAWTQPPTGAYGYSTAGWGPSSNASSTWGGCVDAKPTRALTTIDDPPSTGTPWTQYYYPSDTPVVNTPVYIGGTIDSKSNHAVQALPLPSTSWPPINRAQQTDSQNSCAFQNDMGLNIWQVPPLLSGLLQTTYASPLNTGEEGPNFMCPPPITPMTNDMSTALNAINAVQWVQGDWLPDQGLLWGWNTLSPRWQGQWNNVTDSSGQQLPHPYNTKGWNKAIVWVEGYSLINVPSGCQMDWGNNYNIIDDHIRGAYGYLQEGKLGTTNQNDASAEVQSRAQQICQSLKQDGVYVYLLGYSANGSASGLPDFETNCSTGQNYTFWFGPGDWGAFDTALNSIADSLVNLWVSK